MQTHTLTNTRIQVRQMILQVSQLRRHANFSRLQGCVDLGLNLFLAIGMVENLADERTNCDADGLYPRTEVRQYHVCKPVVFENPFLILDLEQFADDVSCWLG